MVGEVADDSLVLQACLGCVEVHAQGDGSLEELGYLFLYFFCAHSDVGECGFFAGRALSRYVCRVAAVVAGECGGFFVEGERDVAVRAARHPAALLAFDEAGESAAVLEEDDLLFLAECFAHGFDEAR